MKEILEDGLFFFIAAILLFYFIGDQINNYMNYKVSTEAIKAGLVQDSKGHWVKPTPVSTPTETEKR